MEKDLFEKVCKWRRDRGITNPDKQMIKSCEEHGEIAREICRGHYDTPEFRDAIGDTLVTIIVLADICGQNAYECLEEAYQVIANRTGQTEDGCFIKEADL